MVYLHSIYVQIVRALFHESEAAHFLYKYSRNSFVITKIFSIFALLNLKQQL